MPNPDIDKIIDKDADETYPIKNTNTWRGIKYVHSEGETAKELLDNSAPPVVGNYVIFEAGENVEINTGPLLPGVPSNELIFKAKDTKPTDFGTDSTPAAVSLASSNDWQCLTPNTPILQAPAGSIWIFQIALEYQSNSTGLRGIGINGSNTTAPGVIFKQQINAVSGAVTDMVFCSFVAPAADTNYYIWARQNSGQALNVAYRYRVTRIL